LLCKLRPHCLRTSHSVPGADLRVGGHGREVTAHIRYGLQPELHALGVEVTLGGHHEVKVGVGPVSQVIRRPLERVLILGVVGSPEKETAMMIIITLLVENMIPVVG